MLNGVGAILWRAALLRDYDLCLGIALLAAVVVAGARLSADGIRMAIDPRLRTVR
jgi:ABC-type dipeptide/oligopeptide/nickel transport system permease component